MVLYTTPEPCYNAGLVGQYLVTALLQDNYLSTIVIQMCHVHNCDPLTATIFVNFSSVLANTKKL